MEAQVLELIQAVRHLDLRIALGKIIDDLAQLLLANLEVCVRVVIRQRLVEQSAAKRRLEQDGTVRRQLMNWESCEVPKNSFSAATTGRMLIKVCGVIASTS